MNQIDPNLATRLQRFQDLALDKSQSRLWPKIENVLPFYVTTPLGQKNFIPLIQNTRNNRLLQRLGKIVLQKSTLPPAPVEPTPPTPKVAPPPVAPQAFVPPSQDLSAQIKFYQEKLTELSQRDERLQALKINLSRAEQIISQFNEKVVQKENELSSLKKASVAQSTRLEILLNEKRAAEALIKNLQAALKNLETQETPSSELQKLQQRLQNKEREVSEKEQELQNLQQGLSDQTKLQTEIKNLKTEIQRISESKTQLAQNLQQEEGFLNDFKKKTEELTEQNESQINTIQAQEQALEKLAQEKLKLSNFIDELTQKLTAAEEKKKTEEIIKLALPQEKVADKTRKTGETYFVKKAKPPTLETKIPKITHLPNAINGVVTNHQGDFLQNAVVIIKSSINPPLRAMKTNKLGQFAVTTPMNNGRYYLEIHYENLKFDILEIELRGEILPPIQIRAYE